MPDYESLLDQLRQQQSGPIEVLVLDSQRDGLEQIADRLEQLGQTRAIHILSHGDEAGLHLGSNWLSADTIAMRSNTLVKWQGLLTADADVLFYGCDLAANPTGQEFLRTFGQLTGADVGASTDATGAAILGGDWNLEFQSGSVETRSLGESMNLFEWNGLLTTNTYQQGVSSYTGTQDTTISASTPGTGNGASTTVTIGGASPTAGLLRFEDLFGNGPGQIPVGSTIHSASLRVNVTTGTASESTITLHRVLANWSEASTWNTLRNGLSRDNVEAATVADSIVVGTTATGFRTITGLEQSLQAWSDGETNNGWALFGDNTSPWTFTSSEGVTSAQSPMLIVDFTAPVVASTQLQATNEFRVNTTTANTQSTSMSGRGSHDAVGVDSQGNSVVVWTSDLSDGSGAGVYAQRYNANGIPFGAEFRVNSQRTDNQRWASVSVKADGGFIVTWTSQNQDGGGQGIYARIYDYAGVAGSEFRVNSTTAGDQQSPVMGVAADGTFVIAWEGNGSGDSNGIFAQRFNAGGGKQNGEIRINVTTANNQNDPAIAVGQDAQFMVVWDDSIGTHGRRFNASGNALDAADLLLHADYTSGNADVATNGTGDYHIVWRTTGHGDGSGRGIWKMELGAADLTPTPIKPVTTSSINDQTEPSIASDGNGDFIITWQGAGPGDTAGVFARKFLSPGTAQGAELQLNQTIPGSQVFASAAMVNLNNFITVWSGNGAGDSTGVFARTYGTLPNVASLLFSMDRDVNNSGNPDVGSWSTGDVLSFGQPNLSLGSTTSGKLSIAGSLATLGDGNIRIEGLDVVQHDILVGTGANTVQLQMGDVLFSVGANETIGALSVQRDDVVVFRPTVAGSYTGGTFFVLFDGMESVDGGAIHTRGDFDLIEKATRIGDVDLQAGDLVISDIGSGASSIVVFRSMSAGVGVTGGSAFTLIDGTEINLSAQIFGLEVVEQDTTVGGIALHAGDILVALDSAGTIGSNSLSMTKNDLARLVVTQTSVNGPASVTASRLLQGGDIALNGGNERFRSLAMASYGTPPTAQGETYTLTEDQTFNSANQWYNANWSSRLSLTFDNSNRAENLVDFPILVTLDASRFDYALAQASGTDLRFVDANGQVLSYEIETWNPAGRSAIWVKVPQIDSSSATDSIWMYYGNATAPAAQNPTDVWSNGYVGVWHLNGNPSGTQAIADSSSSNVDGTSTGMNSTNQINGPIGGALNFNGTNESIRIATTSSDPTAVNPSHLTIEAWANSTGDSGIWERIINRRNTVIIPFESYGLATSASDRTKVVSTAGTPVLVGTAGSLPEDRWRYLTGVLSGSTSHLYIDGELNAIDTGVLSLGSSEDDITIGAGEMGLDSTLSQFWTGGIDEVRLSNVARSAAWTAAQYESMTDTLITYGQRQTASGLLDNDSSQTAGELSVSNVDTSQLAGVASVTVLDNGQIAITPDVSNQSLAAGQNVTRQVSYTVTDQLGNTSQAIASIVIQGVNDTPVIAVKTGLTVAEGGMEVLTITMLSASDPDNTTAQLTYTITTSPANGRIERVATPGVGITTFTPADLSNSAIRYVHDGSEPTADGFSFSLSDGTATVTGTFSITIRPANDAPVITVNTGLTALEGGNVTLSNTRLAANDADSTPAQLVYALTTPLTNGRLERVAVAGTAITSFTQAEINSSAIRYVHDGSETTSDGFDFSTTDGEATVTGTFGITINPINDTPTLTASSISISEGEAVTLTPAELDATDIDSGSLTFHVTGVSRGRFKDLTTGASVTSFTPTQVQSGQIRFVHDGSEVAPIAMVSVSDGVSSTNAVSITFAFSSINDPPIARADTITASIHSDFVLSPSLLLVNDSDAEHAPLTIRIARPPNHGTLVANPNGTFIYRPHAGYSGSDSFEYSVSDGITSSAAAVVSFRVSAAAPPASNSSGATTSGPNSNSTATGTTVGGSSTTSPASIASHPSGSSASLFAPSPSASFSGANSANSATEGFTFTSHALDEDDLGFSLARQVRTIDEATQRARTLRELETSSANTRPGDLALGSLHTLTGDGHLDELSFPTSSAMNQFRTMLASDANLAAFADVTQSMRPDLTNELIFELPTLAGASLTVGYVVWMLRGGLLITSLLAQVPAWSIVDPLAVLDSLDKSDEDGESIGSLVEQGQSELEPVM